LVFQDSINFGIVTHFHLSILLNWFCFNSSNLGNFFIMVSTKSIFFVSFNFFGRYLFLFSYFLGFFSEFNKFSFGFSTSSEFIGSLNGRSLGGNKGFFESKSKSRGKVFFFFQIFSHYFIMFFSFQFINFFSVESFILNFDLTDRFCFNSSNLRFFFVMRSTKSIFFISLNLNG